MADEVQRFRDLVSQLEADNEQLLQERAAFRDVPGGAAAGPSGGLLAMPRLRVLLLSWSGWL